MTNPKPLPERLGQRVPMLTGMRSGAFRLGYPFASMAVLDYFIVPERVRTPEMVKQAACRRGQRHGEVYQTKRQPDGILVVRIR